MPRMDDRRDRERGERDDRRPAKKPAMNEYFVDGEGIDRQVLQSELCKFLGTDATSRPAEYNGIRGFKIKAIRPFTSEMLVDLKRLSENFNMENRRYPGELSWDDSNTARQWNHQGPPQPGPGGMSEYSSASSGPYVPENMGGGFPPGAGYPQGGPGGYPGYSGPPQMGGMQAPSNMPPGYPGRDQGAGNFYGMSSQPPQGHPPTGYYPPQDNDFGVPRTSQAMSGPPYGSYNPTAGPQDQARGGAYYGEPPMGGMPGGPRGNYGMSDRPPPGSSSFNDQYRQPAQDPGYGPRRGGRP